MKALQISNEVEIIKVKAHIGIAGNEKADELAKEATILSKQTANTLPLTKSQITIAQLSYNKKKMATKSLQSMNYRPFKTEIMQKLIEQKGAILQKNKLHRRSLILVIYPTKTTSITRWHRDLKINPNCCICNTKQTAEHMLVHCPDLDHLRHQLNYRDIHDNIYGEQTLDLTKFTKLVTKSGLFK